MFYKTPQMTKERAKELNLVPINTNFIEVIDLNVDTSNKALMGAWELVRNHFIEKDDCWGTVGYVTQYDYEGAPKRPSLLSRILDFFIPRR